MKVEKTYHDTDGNECSIWQLVRRDPDWAANKVQAGEKDTERLDWLLQRISGKVLREIGVEYSGGLSSMRNALDKAMKKQTQHDITYPLPAGYEI